MQFRERQAIPMPIASHTIPRSKKKHLLHKHARPLDKKGCRDHSSTLSCPHRLVLQSPKVSCLKRPYSFCSEMALRWRCRASGNKKTRCGVGHGWERTKRRMSKSSNVQQGVAGLHVVGPNGRELFIATPALHTKVARPTGTHAASRQSASSKGGLARF